MVKTNNLLCEAHTHTHTHTHTNIYIYIYIYIWRERERQTETETERLKSVDRYNFFDNYEEGSRFGWLGFITYGPLKVI